MELDQFLNSKSIDNLEIDYERMPKIWNCVKKHFDIPHIIHIIGTNGKGSTGRFLSEFLYKKGCSVGHYSSPHILNFNERIWIDGKDVDDEKLEVCHKKVYSLLSDEFKKSISYFEYTTLIAAYCMQKCDYVVMEAGLGGEFDATNVFEKKLTLVTSIGFDHQDILGSDLEEIASTKIKSIKNDAIISKQKYGLVLDIAKKLSSMEKWKFYEAENILEREEIKKIASFVKKRSFPSFFEQNLILAMACVKYLGFDVDISLLDKTQIFGRCQKIAENITLDVGHNTLAAEAVRDHFSEKKVILLYNSFKDKDYRKILSILKSIVKRVEIIPVFLQRAEDASKIKNAAEELSLECEDFKKIDEKEEYLVFGSFSVAEEFLKCPSLEKRKLFSEK